MPLVELLSWILLIPVVGGSIYSVLVMAVALVYMRRSPTLLPDSRGSKTPNGFQPPVTVIKPVCGLEKDLKERLRSACLQDYPDYQVVLAVQNPDDPAVPLLREVAQEFGPDRVTLVVHDVSVGPNGKVNNLLGGLAQARHDVLVISDSDVELRPDYLSAIVAPLDDPNVGAVNTLFKTVQAERWFERMELLTLNADFIPSVIFAEVTGAAGFCLGPSIAIRRSTLETIGGFESLSEYLAEDYELGRRVWTAGLKMALVPYVVDITLDLPDRQTWWKHQVYWDLNTRVANPLGFFATVITRSIPFAVVLALLNLGAIWSLGALAGALAARLVSVAVTARFALNDREAIRALALLPLRDMVGLVTWAMALRRKRVVWRGTEFILMRDGRMVLAA